MREHRLDLLSHKEMGLLIVYSDDIIEGKRDNDIEYQAAAEGKINGFLDCLYLQNRFSRETRDDLFHYYTSERVEREKGAYK